MCVTCYMGHSREVRCCDGLQPVPVVLPSLFSVLQCSDSFLLRRENHEKAAEELLKSLPKVKQILWLFKRCPFGRQKGEVQPGLHVAAREHLGEQYKGSQQLESRSTGSALCRSGGMTQTWHQLKGTVRAKIYCPIQVRRNWEGNCYVGVSSRQQDTRENFWLGVSVVRKAEPA